MIFRRKRDPVKAAVRAIYVLRSASRKLEALEARIEARREQLLNMAVELDRRGEKYLARRYVEEAERLRPIAHRIMVLRYVLERLELGLETIVEMRAFSREMKGVLEVVGVLKKIPETTMPELALMVNEVEASVREAMAAGEASGGVEAGYVPPSSAEVEKILSEARAVAEKELVESLEAPAGGGRGRS